MAYNSIKVLFKPNSNIVEPIKIVLKILDGDIVILKNTFSNNLQQSYKDKFNCEINKDIVCTGVGGLNSKALDAYFFSFKLGVSNSVTAGTLPSDFLQITIYGFDEVN